MMEIVDRCRRIIAIDSSPSCGSMEVANYAMSLCQEAGLRVETIPELHNGRSELNVIAKPYGECHDTDEFLLATPLDTADPGPFSLWKRLSGNPYEAAIIDNCIYGLGAADSKLDYICKVEALASFGEVRTWRRRPSLVATYGEEIGMHGALRLIRKNQIKSTMALIGEPSDLKIIYAGKGFATVEVRFPFSDVEKKFRSDHDLGESTSSHMKVFHGRSAHSSEPQEGDSAILKLLNYIEELPEGISLIEMEGGTNVNTIAAQAHAEFDLFAESSETIVQKIRVFYRELQSLEKTFGEFANVEFSPANPTLNIGLIRTTEDGVQFTGDCRMPANVTQEVYEGWIVRLSKVCESMGVEFRVSEYKKPFSTPKTSIFTLGCLEALRELNQKAVLITQANTNEASLYSRIGVECLGFGPGSREGNIHTPDEHVKISDLSLAIEFYRKVIAKFCL